MKKLDELTWDEIWKPEMAISIDAEYEIDFVWKPEVVGQIYRAKEPISEVQSLLAKDPKDAEGWRVNRDSNNKISINYAPFAWY